MEKFYKINAIESNIYNRWEKSGIFSPRAYETLNKNKKPYAIIMPPPNVTGILHNGHALFVTLEDILIRYHRMKGYNTLWLPGVDHAGIATQTVVERIIKVEQNKSKEELGKNSFLKKIWIWKKEKENKIIEQLKLLGASADWSRYRFTMDNQSSRAVKHAFIKLWNDSLIYRRERIVNWDPVSKTALSNEEVEYVQKKRELFFFAYKLKESVQKEIVVATTRIETMIGDSAVAVHPSDERYSGFVGKDLIHPFFPDRNIKIIEDLYVDSNFGTGAIKVTPAYDVNDCEMGKRHNLNFIKIFTNNGKIKNIFKPYENLDRVSARKKIKNDLIKFGLYRGIQKIVNSVGVSQRSGVEVEPIMSRQYFIKTKILAKQALNAVNNKKIQITPNIWKKTWNYFLSNTQDWCISRQIWWGHKIPIFYNIELMKKKIRNAFKKKDYAIESKKALKNSRPNSFLLKKALIELTEQDIRSFSVVSNKNLCLNNKKKYIQEKDVLDTWFSSGLWPFSVLGWPENTIDFQVFYPTTVLETGFDILFFWVSRMVMLGIYLTGQVPFSSIYLHSMVRDSVGRKMSKSLGNTIDPIDIIMGITQNNLIRKIKEHPIPINKLSNILNDIKKNYPYGIAPSSTDGLRLSLAVLSGRGRDIKLDLSRVQGYRIFLNKVWNAARFTLMRVVKTTQLLKDIYINLSFIDKWIISCLQKTIKIVRNSLKIYRFDNAAKSIYHFFWDDFCNWYIEFSKEDLLDNSSLVIKQQKSVVILYLLESSMRLLHPFCPFISEEIWQKLPNIQGKCKSTSFCAASPFPKEKSFFIDNKASFFMNIVISAVSMIRSLRQGIGLSAKKKVRAIFLVDTKFEKQKLENQKNAIKRVANIIVLSIKIKGTKVQEGNTITLTDEKIRVIISLKDILNTESEIIRIKREVKKISYLRLKMEKRINNIGFMNRASLNIIKETKQKYKNLKKKEKYLIKVISNL